MLALYQVLGPFYEYVEDKLPQTKTTNPEDKYNIEDLVGDNDDEDDNEDEENDVEAVEDLGIHL